MDDIHDCSDLMEHDAAETGRTFSFLHSVQMKARGRMAETRQLNHEPKLRSATWDCSAARTVLLGIFRVA